jgi:uncharacterized protein YbaP (TraB family)
MGLESIEFQMKLVDQTDIRTQALSILGTDMEKEYYDMLKIYKQQDLGALFDLMYKTGDFVDMEEDMLIKRNDKWIPEIETQIKNESTFIAVGAAHLAGSKGLINLLRQKGYTLKPVN